MKNILTSALFFLIMHTTLQAQTKQYDIAMMPALETDDHDIAAYAKDYLLNKIKDEITRNGCSGVNIARFIVLAHPLVISKNNTGQLMLYTYSLQISIVDLLAAKSYNSFSMQLGGVGQTGGQAIMDALRRLDLKQSKLAENIKDATDQITSYYNANCSAIIAKSNTYISSGQFTEAVATLAQIPDIDNSSCKNDYNIAYIKVFKQYSAYKCNASISDAKIKWGLNPTLGGASDVATSLSGVNMNADCKNELDTLIKEIKQKLTTDQFDEKTFRKKVYEDSVSLEKDKVAAMRDIAVEYYKNKISTVYLHL